jgi:transposase
MKYTREERLAIGRRIYEGELSRYDAAQEYEIGSDTARNYMRAYRAEHHLPARQAESNADKMKGSARPAARLEEYELMSKEELINELVCAKIVEARLKKGYMVKGVGVQKEFAPLDSKSTK